MEESRYAALLVAGSLAGLLIACAPSGGDVPKGVI